MYQNKMFTLFSGLWNFLASLKQHGNHYSVLSDRAFELTSKNTCWLISFYCLSFWVSWMYGCKGCCKEWGANRWVVNYFPLMGIISLHRYVLIWIRGKYERVANCGVFRIFHKFITIGHMWRFECQYLKSSSQLCMLDFNLQTILSQYKSVH